MTTSRFKESLEITRVLVAIFMLVTSVFGFIGDLVGWGWYLLAGIVIYPSQINIDFRDK